MLIENVNIFDYVLSEEGVQTSTGIELYMDEIATSGGFNTDQFIALPRPKRLHIAARWLARRHLGTCIQDASRVKAAANRDSKLPEFR